MATGTSLLVQDENSEARYADLTFGRWLRRLGRRLLLVVGTGWVASAATLLLSSASKLLRPEYVAVISGALRPSVVLQVIAVINFSVILSILLLPTRGPRLLNMEEGDPDLTFPSEDHEMRDLFGYKSQDEWNAARSTADTVLRQFQLVWKMLWITWLLLSLPLVVLSLLDTTKQSSQPSQMAAMLFSNCNTLAMLFCYEILAQPTTQSVSHRSRPEVNWSQWIAAVIAFTFVQIVVILVLHVKAMLVFQAVSGICAAVALALFVSRLGSRYFEPPISFLVVMYLYVAIQPLFPILGDSAHPLLQASIIDLALLFKCLLYLYVVWLFSSGRLFFYLLRVAKIDQLVNGEWRRFASLIHGK